MQVGGKRNRTYAMELLNQVHAKLIHVVQPAIWRTHIAALLAHKRGVNPHAVVESLSSIQTREQNSPAILHLGTDLALTLRAELLDTVYHAVAIDKGIELVTANSAYADRAKHLGHIRLLRDWAARSRIAERDGHAPRRGRSAAPDKHHKKH